MGLVLVALYDGVLKLYRTFRMSARGEQTPCEGVLGYDIGNQAVPRRGGTYSCTPEREERIACVHSEVGIEDQGLSQLIGESQGGELVLFSASNTTSTN